MITLDLTEKRFGDAVILGPMRLQVARGEVLGLSGPSGAGKTTLLGILSGLDVRFQGEITASGPRAMVFQEPTLMPWRTVLENLTLATGTSATHARGLLARVGLEGLEDHWPGQLSLGQARRVGLARAFAARPAILLMDEPFTSLDAERVGDLVDLTAQLIAESKPAVILASHSEEELARLSTRRARIEGRPARLVQDAVSG